MSILFLDESGDLGFKKKSSKWFVITIAIVQNQRALEKVVRSIWRPLKRKHKKLGELHAYHADEHTRVRMLKKLSELKDLSIVCVVLNKAKVYVDLRNQNNILYNYTANILLDRLYGLKKLPSTDPINLFIDRKDTKKMIRENFVSYLERSMESKRMVKMNVTLHTSHENKSLQAVDFISWSIFRKYERADDKYYNIIKNKIIGESPLFP